MAASLPTQPPHSQRTPGFPCIEGGRPSAVSSGFGATSEGHPASAAADAPAYLAQGRPPTLRGMHTTRPVVAFMAMAAVLTGCSALTGPAAGDRDAGVSYPAGCTRFDLSRERCEAIVESIARQHDIDPSAASEIWLLGDPGCGDDPHILCARTTSFVVRVRFVLPGHGAIEDSQFCGVGGQFSILCTDNPEIRLSAPTLDGYRDIPCSGEPPDGCASPVPTVVPATASHAVPLHVPTIGIPLDREGRYDIPLGQAVLPNGILTEGSFTLADAHQTGYTLEDGVIALVVAGPDGKPISNVYEQGWRDGTETVQVSLKFSVAGFEPGAVIRVRDVVVR
jgi:hypothetical protein